MSHLKTNIVDYSKSNVRESVEAITDELLIELSLSGQKLFKYLPVASSRMPIKLTKTHIEENWKDELNNTDPDINKTLQNYIQSCKVGDVWSDGTHVFTCISIND